MKKSLLLLLALSAGLTSYAQNGKLKPIKSPLINQSLPIQDKPTLDVVDGSSTEIKGNASVGTSNKQEQQAIAIVGASAVPLVNTTYDLQTNSSVRNAIAIDPLTGQISSVCTFSPSPYNSTNPNRGTGYNYSANGGASWLPLPIVSLESSMGIGGRSGWPSICYTNSGELIVTHGGIGANTLNIMTRNTRGSGAISLNNSVLASPDVSNGSFWPRVVSNGDNVHLISVVNVGTTGAVLQGMSGALTYCRSTDGGLTWLPGNLAGTNHSIIPGLDSNYFNGFGGDAYAIAVRGNTVAIVAADSWNGIRLAKSNDNGNTWTSQWVDSLPKRKYDPATGFPAGPSACGGGISDFDGDNIADTIYSNDESVSVTLDNNNIAHVFYGVSRILDDSCDVTYDFSSYFPITDGLAYWHEGMNPFSSGNDMSTKVIIAGMEDLNNNGQIDITAQVSGNNESILGGYRSSSMTSMPSAYAANGSIYLAYSSVVESSLYQTGAGANRMFRHVYMMKSDDNGITWSCPNDIMSDNDAYDSTTIQEGVWPSIAAGIHGGNLHVVYQRDYVPGNGLNGCPTCTDPDNNGPVSEWLYSAINPADLTTSNLPNYFGNSQACIFYWGVEENRIIADLKIYPNPTNTNATVKVELKQNSSAIVSVTNMLGEIVSFKQFEGVLGANTINLDVNNLNAGVYFINVKVGNSLLSNKLIIQK